jgi:hypothetical protein
MTWRTTSGWPIEFVRPPEPEPLLTEQRTFGGQHRGRGEWARRRAHPRGPCQVRTPTTAAEPILIDGRPMGPGSIHLYAEDVRTKRQLETWIEIGVSFARSLPPKQHPTQGLTPR